MTNSTQTETTERPGVFGDLKPGDRARIPDVRIRLDDSPPQPVGDYGPLMEILAEPWLCGDCDDLILLIRRVDTLERTSEHRPADWPILVVTA